MPNPLPSPIPYHTYHGQHLDEPAIYDYVTDAAGVVMRVKTPHFYAVHRCAFGHVRGLKRWPEEADTATPGTQAGVLLSVPKIPAAWLARVLAHARKAGGGARTPDKLSDEELNRLTQGTIDPGKIRRYYQAVPSSTTIQLPVEQMYHFHHIGGAWQVAIPKQTATAARVTYRGGNEASIALDLHSHHEMGAYFSPTDDRDELGARFYAVIGRIYSRPEIRLRLGLYGIFIDLAATTLFEDLGPFCDVYQPETEGAYKDDDRL